MRPRMKKDFDHGNTLKNTERDNRVSNVSPLISDKNLKPRNTRKNAEGIYGFARISPLITTLRTKQQITQIDTDSNHELTRMNANKTSASLRLCVKNLEPLHLCVDNFVSFVSFVRNFFIYKQEICICQYGNLV